VLSKVDEIVDTGETIQKSVHPSMFDSNYVHGYMVGFTLLIIIIGVLAANSFVLDEGVPVIFVAPLLVVPAALLLRSEIGRRKILYHFTDRQIIEEQGILNKDYQSIAYSRVQDVQLNEAMEERMFNVGDLLIKTAGSSGAEVVLDGLKNPESYQRLISKRANDKNDDGGVSTGSNEFGGASESGSQSAGQPQSTSGIDDGYIESELNRVNNEIERLNRRSNNQGLSESERERWYKLEGQRELLERMQEDTEDESSGDFDSEFSSNFSSDF
jgi:membrane protein YdbS with pleckstrin-like domain